MPSRSVVRTPVRGVVSSGLRLPRPLSFMPLRTNTALLIGSGSETFARTNAVATFLDNDTGLITLAGANVARFEVTGLLMEGAIENKLLKSKAFDDAAWALVAAGNGSNPVATPDVADAPDGTATADRIVIDQGVDSGGDDLSFIRQVVAAVTDGTCSVWARSNTAGNFTIDISADGLLNPKVITPTFQRFTDGAASATRLHMALRNSAVNDTADIIASFAQLEDLAFASSVIPTDTVAVTRSADSLDIAAANIPGPTADYTVSFECDAVGFDSALSQVLFNVEGETSRTIEWNTTTGAINATHGAVTSVSSSTFSAGDKVKVAFVVDGTNQTLYINGIQEDQDAKGTATGTATLVNIGHEANTNEAYSHITNLKTFDVALSANQVKGL